MSSTKAVVRRAAGRVLRAAPDPIKRQLRQGASRLLAALPPRDIEAPSPPPVPPYWKPNAVPSPPNVSLVDVERLFRSWSVNGDAVGALDPYVDDSLWRFLHTWSMVEHEAGSCLEIGANPYFTTFLIDKHTKLELTLTNYYGHPGDAVETVSYEQPDTGERTQLQYRSTMLNVEDDTFPFDDSSFNVVLFCETIEHLLMDPVHALCEIHRVLEPGGVLILTTPNVARLQNVLSLLGGDNIYDPYSGFGPYGRHNREYTGAELRLLLEFTGFEVEHLFTADGHPWEPAAWPVYPMVVPLVQGRRLDLGQYLFARARSLRPSRLGLPSFLYRSWPEGRIVNYPAS